MLEKTGVPTNEQVVSKFFDESVMLSYKAIIECYEDIPCNPCATSCPVKAITIEPNIHAQPFLDPSKCTGCSICVTTCPGLAIVLASVSGSKARFKIPYEMNEIFNMDDVVFAMDRHGKVIGEAKIIAITNLPRQLKTKLVTVEVERSMLHDFITIRGKCNG